MLALFLVIKVMNSVDLRAPAFPVKSNDAVSEVDNIEAVLIREDQQQRCTPAHPFILPALLVHALFDFADLGNDVVVDLLENFGQLDVN